MSTRSNIAIEDEKGKSTRFMFIAMDTLTALGFAFYVVIVVLKKRKNYLNSAMRARWGIPWKSVRFTLETGEDLKRKPGPIIMNGVTWTTWTVIFLLSMFTYLKKVNGMSQDKAQWKLQRTIGMTTKEQRSHTWLKWSGLLIIKIGQGRSIADPLKNKWSLKLVSC